MKIDGKHVFVTGAGKRIGRAIAESLVQSSARLTAHYFTSVEAVQDLKRQSPHPDEVFIVQADLKNGNELREAVEKSVKAQGPIDILVNCASQFPKSDFLTTSETLWDEVQRTNCKGPFFLAQACAKNMSSGVIINIVDVFARKPLKNFAAYSAAEAGLLMLTRSLALELAPNIRVNSVSPGPVLLPPDYDETRQAQIAGRTWLQRVGNPNDVVSAVKFLIENDYITGFDLVVDGGLSI